MPAIDAHGALHDNEGRYANQNKPSAGFDLAAPPPSPERYYDTTQNREVTAKFVEGYQLAHEEYQYGATREQLLDVRGIPGVRVEPDEFWEGIEAGYNDQENGRDRFFRGPLHQQAAPEKDEHEEARREVFEHHLTELLDRGETPEGAARLARRAVDEVTNWDDPFGTAHDDTTPDPWAAVITDDERIGMETARLRLEDAATPKAKDEQWWAARNQADAQARTTEQLRSLVDGYAQQGRTGAEPGGEHIKAFRDELARRLTADHHTPDK